MTPGSGRASRRLSCCAKRERRLFCLRTLAAQRESRILKYSLKPVAEHLMQMIPPPVSFSPEVIGPEAEAASKALPDAGVLLVENVRFFKEEEANEEGFAQALARLGDVYVNDAFGAAHRAHASTAGVARYLPQAAMGLLMERELQYLHEELAQPGQAVSGDLRWIKGLR